MNNLGITCFLGELFEAEKYLNNKKFDFIILSHVLEHIYDIKKATAVLKNLLNANGMIYTEVEVQGMKIQTGFDGKHVVRCGSPTALRPVRPRRRKT